MGARTGSWKKCFARSGTGTVKKYFRKQGKNILKRVTFFKC
jgi:hypothetical protein